MYSDGGESDPRRVRIFKPMINGDNCIDGPESEYSIESPLNHRGCGDAVWQICQQCCWRRERLERLFWHCTNYSITRSTRGSSYWSVSTSAVRPWAVKSPDAASVEGLSISIHASPPSARRCGNSLAIRRITSSPSQPERSAIAGS